jgi:multiple antibiotic resistance protein
MSTQALLVWNSFLIAFSALLPIINPLGTALVFLGLVGEAEPSTYRALARKIAINNVVFLGIVELLGSAILQFFGISLPIVQVSGGLVIAAIAWSTLNANDSDKINADKISNANIGPDYESDELNHSLAALQRKAFYPFTFPVTSGPGTLVVALTLTARFNGAGTTTDLVLGHIGLFLAIVALSVGVYFCYGYAPRITAAIPASTVHGILRVVAFILLCIGVQIAWNGMSVLLASVGHH